MSVLSAELHVTHLPEFLHMLIEFHQKYMCAWIWELINILVLEKYPLDP